ncbi:MAG TPA: LURP-one-related family protein [Streptosporangiaceae bacterium]
MKFQVRERIFGFGDDFWIVDEHGDRAFFVDGKVLRLHDTLELKDLDGNEVATVHKKVLSIRDAMKVERGGETVATVRKALFTPFHEKFTAELTGTPAEIEITGNLIDKEFRMELDGATIAVVSRKWFRVRDTYGVEMADDADAPLLLAVAVCVDRLLEHEKEEKDDDD